MKMSKIAIISYLAIVSVSALVIVIMHMNVSASQISTASWMLAVILIIVCAILGIKPYRKQLKNFEKLDAQSHS